jgi:hypothetical protein
MSNHGSDGVSRRHVLRVTSGTAVGLGLVGTASADEGESDRGPARRSEYVTPRDAVRTVVRHTGGVFVSVIMFLVPQMCDRYGRGLYIPVYGRRFAHRGVG